MGLRDRPGLVVTLKRRGTSKAITALRIPVGSQKEKTESTPPPIP